MLTSIYFKRTIWNKAIGLFGFLIINLSSCYQEHALEHALTFAKDHRPELEKVLQHYQHQTDKQKLQAAEFLIANMPGAYSLDTNSIAANQPYFDALIAFRLRHGGKYGDRDIYMICDSVRAVLPDNTKLKPMYKADIASIPAQFLIDHIDRSFEAWRKYPWAKDVPFDMFCRYILPYKSKDSYWEGAHGYFSEMYAQLPDSIARKSFVGVGHYIDSDIKGRFRSDVTFFKENYSFLQPVTFRNLVHAQLGECVDINCAGIAAIRSMAVPAALNVIPYWGNSNARHFWTEIIGDTLRKRYNNVQQAYSKPEDELISDMFWFKYPFTTYEGIPPEVTIRMCRTVPKVFRDSYAMQRNSLVFETNGVIPPFFRNTGLEDVTTQYVECADPEISLWKTASKHKHAYLCCYDPDNETWTPVDWAPVKRNRATFHNVGINVLYLPVYYSEQPEQAGEPFVLMPDGSQKQLIADLMVRDTAILYSKVPYRAHILFYASTMLGSQFQVANRPDMSDTVNLHYIRKIPFYGQEVEITDAPPSRYAIYRFGEQPYGFIAELEFWGLDEHGREVKLQGKPIGNPGLYGNEREEAMDGDRVSFFFRAPGKEPYIGFDFGVPCSITRIKYCPRSDDNGIVPGEMYELFYWDKGWISLGKQDGRSDYRLLYTNIPRNALLRLHNHTRGKEHRPFTCENGKQVWW